MRGAAPTRYALLGLILFSYFVPLGGLSLYLALAFDHPYGLTIAAGGLSLAMVGSTFLFIVLQQWEQLLADKLAEVSSREEGVDPSSIGTGFEEMPEASLKNSAAFHDLQNSLTEWQQKCLTNESSLNKREQEIYLLAREKERFQRQAENLLQEFVEYRSSHEEQLHQKEIFISELQQTLAEQRISVEKKQQQVTLLENKVGELRYEIRTLLQLAEVHAPFSINKSIEKEQLVSSPTNMTLSYHREEKIQENKVDNNRNNGNEGEELTQQLRRCIEVAEKMTGAPQFSSGHKRLADLPINPFSLDLRRLCDALANQNSGAALLYSPREKQLLFAHPLVKQFCGWSPEKFTQHFDEIIAPSMEEWQRAIAHLSYRLDTPLCLRLQTKNNETMECECLMGLIPSGVFRNYAIGILQPVEELLSSHQTTA